MTLSDLTADRWLPIAVSIRLREHDDWQWHIPRAEADIVPDARAGGFIVTTQVRDRRTGRHGHAGAEGAGVSDGKPTSADEAALVHLERALTLATKINDRAEDLVRTVRARLPNMPRDLEILILEAVARRLLEICEEEP